MAFSTRWRGDNHHEDDLEGMGITHVSLASAFRGVPAASTNHIHRLRPFSSPGLATNLLIRLPSRNYAQAMGMPWSASTRRHCPWPLTVCLPPPSWHWLRWRHRYPLPRPPAFYPTPLNRLLSRDGADPSLWSEFVPRAVLRVRGAATQVGYGGQAHTIQGTWRMSPCPIQWVPRSNPS